MQALKFTLSGNTAFFKKPEVNAYFYFTYGHIHKVALLGMFGAILGLKGYNHQKIENTVFPEFYEKLESLKIAVVPKNAKGYINKKVQQFNNSTAFASNELGGNLIVKEQWLENPNWDIYILLDNDDYSYSLTQSIVDNKSVYIPYLGKNDHFAKISNVQYVEVEKYEDGIDGKIISLCFRDNVEIKKSEVSNLISLNKTYAEPDWYYEEKLPHQLTKETNQYILEKLMLTNKQLTIVDNKESFFKLDSNKIIQFI